MSLEALYKAAEPGTYVGKVRTRQEESSGATTGVNFMDGERRSRNNETADEFQTEFKRNAPGANVAGGAQPPAGLSEDNSESVLGGLSRWTDRAVKLAFDASSGEGPASLAKGFYHTPATFRVSKRGLPSDLHNYIPSNGYTTANTFANERYNAGPTST